MTCIHNDFICIIRVQYFQIFWNFFSIFKKNKHKTVGINALKAIYAQLVGCARWKISMKLELSRAVFWILTGNLTIFVAFNWESCLQIFLIIFEDILSQIWISLQNGQLLDLWDIQNRIPFFRNQNGQVKILIEAASAMPCKEDSSVVRELVYIFLRKGTTGQVILLIFNSILFRWVDEVAPLFLSSSLKENTIYLRPEGKKYLNDLVSARFYW